MNKKTKIVFMGTPEFSVLSLRRLHEAGYEIAGVVTQPDRPKGRGHKLAATPVKEEAAKLGLNILQPARIKEEGFIDILAELKPDLIIVVAFGQILPRAVLKLPQFGCINVHASLLPQYRGAAPIHRAIINGETVTGITTMLMDEGLDTGDILLKERVVITPQMNFGKLHDLLAEKGAELLVKTLEIWLNNGIEPEKQENKAASYAAILKHEDELIDWENPAQAIYNQIRGLDPWPGAYTYFKDKPLKIRAAKLSAKQNETVPSGTVLENVKGEGFAVQTGQGVIIVTKVQPFGKTVMPAESFINGYSLEKGYIFKNA